MQVNTKEILLNHPSKGLAQCALQLWKEGVRTIVRAFHFSCSMFFAAAGIQPEKGRETNISYVRLYGLSKFQIKFRRVETDF